MQTKQQKEPLQPHPVPERPWEVVGADLFELNGQTFLVTVARLPVRVLGDRPTPDNGSVLSSALLEKTFCTIWGACEVCDGQWTTVFFRRISAIR